MNLRPTYQYLFKESMKALGLVYLWLIVVFLFLPAMIAMLTGTFNDFSLKDQLSAQFLSIPFGFFLFFYFALNATHFKFLIQNGIGRKTFWVGKTLVAGVTIITGEMINLIYFYAIYAPIAGSQEALFTGINTDINGHQVVNSLASIFYGRFTGNFTIDFLLTLLVTVIGAAALVATGMAVGAIMSLFSKRTKLIVIIGVPIVLLVLATFVSNLDLPTIKATWVFDFIKFSLGAGDHAKLAHFNPVMPMIFGIIYTAIMLWISRFFNLKLQVHTD